MVSNQEKVMIIRKKKCCKPRKKSRFAKKSQKISTHILTVLIMSVILRIEQKINGYLNIDKYPFVKEERV